MKNVSIQTNNKNYSVFIGDCLFKLPEYLYDDKKVLIITDNTVKDYHLNTLNQFVKTDYIFSLDHIPENSKNIETYHECVEYCMKHYLDRNLVVLAFGGGAVTDLAGFFASTYKRGVSLIHVPTTLLSHDSAVGGKTALNINETKNVIGSIYQPDAVIYHLDFLMTLPKKEILSGFGEIFKHDLLSEGFILNELLDDSIDLKSILDKSNIMEEILYRSILVKKLYIEMDIYDRLGKRQFLNFGHTLAHAIERLDEFSHGEAVAFGMCFDLFLSDNGFYQTFYNKLKQWGYFNQLPQLSLEEMIPIIKNDKKNELDLIKFIGLKTIGQPFEIHLTVPQFIEKWNLFKQVLS